MTLIIFQYKFPARTTPIHGPILIISLLGYILWGHGGTDGKGLNPIPSSIAGLFEAMIIGILFNSKWLFTAVSIIITFGVYLTYYAIVF